MLIQNPEFEVFMDGGPESIGIRSPKDLPTHDPRHDAYFMNRELRAVFELGVHGHPWRFQNFYMIRLWWYRTKFHAIAVKSFRAGKVYRNVARRTGTS